MSFNLIFNFFDLSWNFADDANIARCFVDDEVVSEKHEATSLDDEKIPSVVYEESTLESIVKPLHILSEWTMPGTTTRRLSSTILLPSGVLLGKFSVCVGEDVCALKLLICWPNPLVDSNAIPRE